MPPEIHWSLNLAPVLMMLVIVIGNHVMMHHRNSRREAIEAKQLRAALLSEIAALRDIYKVNLGLIQRKAGYLISSRSPMVIYKANQARLMATIETPALELIVSLYAKNDIIEELLSAQSSLHGNLSFKLRPDSDVEHLRLLYTAGMQHTVQVFRALNPGSTEAQPLRLRSRFTSSVFRPAMVPAPTNG